MKRSERIVKANQENLMMLYVRPKKPEDINVGDPKYFSHFLFHLFKNKVNNQTEVTSVKLVFFKCV